MTTYQVMDLIKKGLRKEDCSVSKGFNVLFINFRNGQEFSVHITENKD